MLTVENLTGTHSVSMPVTVTAPEEALELLGQYPLAGAEYFIDRDPGYGAGTAISILPGMNAEMKVGIATGDLSLGTHTLYVRVKDEKGYWGIPEARSFTVAPLSSVALQAAEYFIDQDPGYGAGTAIPIDPAVSTTRTFTAPIQNLESGFHSLYVRVQDQDGNWGIPEPRPFYIVPQASLSPLAELEYFFNDADPGVGKAQKIKTSGSGVVDLTALLPTEGLAIGSHTVTIRAKNTAGIWGLGNQVPFVINEKGPNAAPVAVRKIERQELKPGGAPYALPVAGETPLFTDSNGDALSYEVSSSKESVATVSLSDGVLRVTPVGEGGTTVTVKAADGASGTATLTFQVVVRGDPNNPPVLSRAISEQVLSLGGESFTRDLRGDSPAFTDADQDAVTFVVESSDEKVVVASVSEGVLKVSPVVEGTATVTVRADDGKGGTASMTFRVSVVREAVTAQIGVDLQVGSNGDGVLKQENAIEAPPGQPVTVEIFASGYDGTLGMQAVFFLDHPEAVLSAKANKSEALPILLGDGVSLDGNRLEVFLGSLEEVREEGDGLKLVGSVTLTLADGFEGLTLTLETVVFEANVSRAAPGLMLTVKPILDVPNPDINEDGVVDFKDFILFARAFGGEDGDEKYQKRIDLDRDGEIGFRDFVLFAQWFGRDPLEFVPPANRIALAKAAGNSGGAVSLRLEAGSAGRSDEAVVVVEVAGEMDIEGYSFTVQYDERALVWIGAEALAPSRFVASGEPAIVQDGTGEVVLADMLGSPVVREAGGDLVLLRFQTKDENLSGAVEIAGALVSDRSGRLGELTGAMLEAVRPVPSEPALLRNFPNPFNPVTQIHYQLQGTEDVSLVVYNVLGQRVRVLVQERQVAGYYRLAWDGEDAVGRPVSSGIYLYRLTAGKFAATRRMLLLK